MAETRQKISLRLPPGLLDAGRRAIEEGVSLTWVIETALADGLGISPERFDPQFEALRGRVERLERREKLLSEFGLALYQHITPAGEEGRI
jgi:hypothetical protein